MRSAATGNRPTLLQTLVTTAHSTDWLTTFVFHWFCILAVAWSVMTVNNCRSEQTDLKGGMKCLKYGGVYLDSVQCFTQHRNFLVIRVDHLKESLRRTATSQIRGPGEIGFYMKARPIKWVAVFTAAHLNSKVFLMFFLWTLVMM